MALKYFLDQEFIEGYVKPVRWLPTIGRFNKPRWTIQLISIGIVCEDGRKYYAVSTEFNENDADQWVKDNVLSKLPPKQIIDDTLSPFVKDSSTEGYPAHYVNPVYKSLRQIAYEVFMFMQGHDISNFPDNMFGDWDYIRRHKEFIKTLIAEGDDTNHAIKQWRELHNAKEEKVVNFNNSQFDDYMYYAQPIVYGYYADYDHVCFCSQLFGRMIELPSGFPMYMRDLKQEFDSVVTDITNGYFKSIKDSTDIPFNRSWDEMFEMNAKGLKDMRDYPKQDNEHNALDDAEFNYNLFKFIQKYKPEL